MKNLKSDLREKGAQWKSTGKQEAIQHQSPQNPPKWFPKAIIALKTADPSENIQTHKIGRSRATSAPKNHSRESQTLQHQTTPRPPQT